MDPSLNTPIHPEDTAEATMAAGLPPTFTVMPLMLPQQDHLHHLCTMLVQAHPDMTTTSTDNLLIQAAVFTSLVEEVIHNTLVKAGEIQPPQQQKHCWGCDGPHLFRDCPNKNNPDVL
jgi:hypothetical protein